MIETLFAIVITAVVLAIVVPITLVWLLVRQVRRTRVVRGLRAARRAANVDPKTVPGGGAPLLRPWSSLAFDAAAARERFVHVAASVPPGPLASSLAQAVREVDEAVADARRLAHEGSAIDRAHREVCAALARQRKRARRTPAAPDDLAGDLLASTAAQQASAQRLEQARRDTLCQLQLLVARLAELNAHALELTTVARLPQGDIGLSIAQRLAALQQATAEVERLTPAGVR